MVDHTQVTRDVGLVPTKPAVRVVAEDPTKPERKTYKIRISGWRAWLLLVMLGWLFATVGVWLLFGVHDLVGTFVMLLLFIGVLVKNKAAHLLLMAWIGLQLAGGWLGLAGGMFGSVLTYAMGMEWLIAVWAVQLITLVMLVLSWGELGAKKKEGPRFKYKVKTGPTVKRKAERKPGSGILAKH